MFLQRKNSTLSYIIFECTCNQIEIYLSYIWLFYLLFLNFLFTCIYQTCICMLNQSSEQDKLCYKLEYLHISFLCRSSIMFVKTISSMSNSSMDNVLFMCILDLHLRVKNSSSIENVMFCVDILSVRTRQ